MANVVAGGREGAEPGGRLAELERVVVAGVQGFLAAGLALEEIRAGRLYRVVADSWATYLRERWGMSVQSAHRIESAAVCARAITRAGLELPASASPELLRPCGRVLRASGEQGVVEAWRMVLDAHDGSRPLSGERVRSILASADAPTVAPDRRREPLKPIACSLSRALVRARALQGEYAGKVPPVSVRARAAVMAAQARGLADVLEQLADTTAAAVRLAAVEAPARAPFGTTGDDAAAGDLCIGYGAQYDDRGRCTGCGRADLSDRSRPAPRRGAAGTQDRLPAAAAA